MRGFLRSVRRGATLIRTGDDRRNSRRDEHTRRNAETRSLPLPICRRDRKKEKRTKKALCTLSRESYERGNKERTASQSVGVSAGRGGGGIRERCVRGNVVCPVEFVSVWMRRGKLIPSFREREGTHDSY